MPTENLAERKVQMPVATTMPQKWHIARPPKMVPAMKIVIDAAFYALLHSLLKNTTQEAVFRFYFYKVSLHQCLTINYSS